jgi:histidyl-tRNA synthetase
LGVFFVVADGAPRERVLGAVAELRRAGIAADVDYAGRSLKGQLTQAGRTRARTVVVVTGTDAAVRREGAVEQLVALDDVVATLTSP